MSDNIRQLGFSPDKFRKVETYLESTIETKRAPGIVLSLARADQAPIFRSYGQSSIEQQLSCTPQTLYRIASLTKPIISVAFMLLVEKGLCSIDDPVAQWLPRVNDMQVMLSDEESDFEAINTTMTLKHLLTHTSGLCYDFNAPAKIRQKYARTKIYEGCETTADFSHILLQLPLAFQPGTGYFYGFSTDVLGHIIELISKQPLDEYLRQHIFEPLNMSRSGFSVNDNANQVASVYTAAVDDGKHSLVLSSNYDSNAVFNAPSIFSAGGGLWSTTEDYMKFLQMLMAGGVCETGELITEKSLDLMTRNHLSPAHMPFNIGAYIDYDTDGYGFGFNFKVLLNPTTKDYMVSEGEYGWAGSINTYAWVDPRRELAVAVFSQYVPFACYPLEQELKKLIYDALIV